MVRVLLAGAQHMLRGALAALLDAEDDLEVVADVDRIDQLGPVWFTAQADVVVVDIDAYGEDGIDQVGALRYRLPTCPVVILTGWRTATIKRSSQSAEADVAAAFDARFDAGHGRREHPAPNP